STWHLATTAARSLLLLLVIAACVYHHRAYFVGVGVRPNDRPSEQSWWRQEWATRLPLFFSQERSPNDSFRDHDEAYGGKLLEELTELVNERAPGREHEIQAHAPDVRDTSVG